MLKNSSRRALLPAAIIAVTIGLAPLPAAHAAVGEMLNRLPAGEISCDQAAAHWTNDADYQARVAQAQTIAAIDPRGGQIVAVLGRVDAAAERCGLKGTVSTGGAANDGNGSGEGGAGDTAPEAGTAAGEGQGAAAGGSDGGPGATANPGASEGSGDSSGSSEQSAPPVGGGGTPEAPVTDAEAVLGPIRNNPSTPTKTIEVLGQGQVEVADAEAMMANFLRQFTIIT